MAAGEDWSKDFTQGEVSERVNEININITLYHMYMHVCVFWCAGISSLQGVISSLGVEKAQGQPQRGGKVIWTGSMGNRGGGAIRKAGENMEVYNSGPNNHT